MAELELFALYQHNLSLAERREIETHIASCAFCSDIVDEIQALEHSADQFESEQCEDASERLLKRIRDRILLPEHVIPFYPVPEKSTDIVREAAPFRLAAKSSMRRKRMDAVSLTNINKDMIVRILIDHERSETSIQVMSTETLYYDTVLLRCSTGTEILTNERGQAQIPHNECSEFEEDYEMLLYPPLCTMEITTDIPTDGRPLECGVHTISFHEAENGVLISATSALWEKSKHRWLGIIQPAKRLILPLPLGSGLIPASAWEPPFVLKLY